MVGTGAIKVPALTAAVAALVLLVVAYPDLVPVTFTVIVLETSAPVRV